MRASLNWSLIMSEYYVYYGKSKTKYPATMCTCVFCGKQFLMGTRWLKRTAVLACSTECRKAYNAKIKSNREAEELSIWRAENHKCERCGKVMTEKFGSGRFCSEACSHSHDCSEDTRDKIKQSLAAFYEDPEACLKQIRHGKTPAVLQAEYDDYTKSPKLCCICSKPIPYKERHRQTCSNGCYKALLAINAKKNKLGGLTGACGKYSKKGKYKGIRCDSTYELIYLVYCELNNISVKRNNKYFIYTNFEGKTRKYYPDFYLPDSDTYVELKGYKDNNVDLKLAAMKQQDKQVSILYKKDLKVLLDDINTKLNKNYKIDYSTIVELYDR